MASTRFDDHDCCERFERDEGIDWDNRTGTCCCDLTVVPK